MAFRKSGKTGAGKDLSKIDFFEGFSPAELDRVAALSEVIDAEEGALLMDQGKVGRECFVILEGKAAVYIGDHYVATLESGSTVGEMAIIDQRPRSASVKAVTDMKLLAFDTEHFRTLLEEMPKASRRVMADMNAKLRHQNLSD